MKKFIIFIMAMMLFPILTNAAVKIDGVSYTDPDAANNEIHDDSVIILESDYINNSDDIENINILLIQNDNVTIDLNGHAIDTISVITNHTNVKIKNGTISSKFGAALFVGANSTVYLNNTVINVQGCGSRERCGSSDPNDGIYNNAIVNEGTLSIEDCKFSFDNTILNKSGAEMSIRQSMFITNPSSINNSGTLKIDGATKSTGTLSLYTVGNNYSFDPSATITVDGITCINTFAASDVIKDGSEVVFNGDYRNTTGNADLAHVLVINNKNVSVNLNDYNIDSIWIANETTTGITIQNGNIFNKKGSALVVFPNCSVTLSNINIGAFSCGDEECGTDVPIPNKVIYNSGTITITGGLLDFTNSIFNDSGANLVLSNVRVLSKPATINNSGSVSINGTTKREASIDLFNLIPTYLGDWNNDGNLDGQDVVICRKYLANDALVKNQYPDIEENRKAIADLKKDGKIDLVDLVNLRLKVANSVQ